MIAIKKDAMRYRDPETGKFVGVSLIGGDAPSGIVTNEPADGDIPKIYFTGTTPTSKGQGDVQLFMRYVSKTARIEKPVTLKVQGDSSANYPKKNFTMKTYADSAYVVKENLTFKGWPAMNKFVLKAHWMDHSHVRNVGTAKIWGKIVASRSDYASLPEELRMAANNGATDGFTCKVFVNGVYQGLYELIVPKDKLFGQTTDVPTHSIMNSEQNNQATCAFATTSPTISGNWSEELQDSMSSAISTSFANFIKFVAGSTDEEFVANAETYFDVQSVIDFDIFARIFCIVDNICKNQIFFTYDGSKWYEGAWDLDGVLGNPPTVRGYFAYNTAFQTGYVAYKDHGITNRLYERVETLFMDRFKSRYAELRADILSAGNIVDVYERMTDVITTYDGLLQEDYASTTGGGAFTSMPYQSENNIQQIRNFVAARLPYMDEQVEAIAPPAEQIPCTGITLDQTTLTFDGRGTQTLTATVTPSNTSDAVVWSTDANTVATVKGGVVTAVGNGSATITATCGAHSATCAVSVSGIEETTEPPALIDVDSSTLTPGATTWTNAAGEDVFTFSEGATLDDGGLVMNLTKITSINTVALTGTFTAETTLTRTGSPTSTPTVYGFNLNNATKYCDCIRNNGEYGIRGYDSDVMTSIVTSLNEEVVVRVVYNSDGISVYKDGQFVATYDKKSFTANGAYNVILGWSSGNNGANNTRKFSIRRFRLWNESVHYPKVPCTGITLDQSTLTFTAAGTQTLTATVTPSNTTDPVSWSTDAPSVASVNGGVVTAKANGSATITATCGAYSATCAVSVSGIGEENADLLAWENSGWNKGYYNDSGTLVEKETNLSMHHSDMIPVSHDSCYTIQMPAKPCYMRFSFFDADGKHIGWDRGGGLNANANDTTIITTNVPDVRHDVAYMVINANTADKSEVTLTKTAVAPGVGLLEGCTLVAKKYINYITGEYADNNGNNTAAIPEYVAVSAGKSYVLSTTNETSNLSVNMAFYDDNKAFVSSATDNKLPYMFTVPDGASYLRFHAGISSGTLVAHIGEFSLVES